ncbi:response regulator [Agaribacter flavus]|uniref:Response regulator n=1 Tax=Agaribacter flavus TaxID=1902781 RepID=A0ABV7FT07_9ALTE
MSLPVLICDDSAFARKAMARSLPDGWDVEVSFASNGQEAIEAIEQGKGDMLFLDLNMPVMDGYETMQVIRERDLPTMVIVVSGDVQEEAHRRMKSMGAIDFIRKPIDNAKLTDILSKYGIYNGEKTAAKRAAQTDVKIGSSLEEKMDAFREISNVAMGQAGESLAQVFKQFVNLPIPNVSMVHTNELAMTLASIDSEQQVSAISKGFVSKHIKGEAIIIFNDANIASVRNLLGRQRHATLPSDIEVLMDVSNIIIGACINGLSEQLGVNFTHNSPIILGIHCDLNELVANNISRWEQVLVIEIAYAISKENINFELLLVIPETEIDATFKQLINVRGAA